VGKIAFLFPGQGSQNVGMGSSIAHVSEAAARTMQEADAVSGKPITTICYEGPRDVQAQTANSQPIIFTVDCACLAALREKGVQPDMVAGHSLGEYAALVAADVLDFAQALRLVVRRAELMQIAGTRYPGKMLAVVGLEVEQVRDIVDSLKDQGRLQAANYNCPGQIAVSGDAAVIDKAAPIFEQAGARVVELAVSGAFHSPLMAEAAEEFAGILDAIEFRNAKMPVVSNFTGKAATDAQTIRAALREQITGSVLWQQTVEEMIRQGVDTFVEVGPGRVLRGLVKKTAPKANILNVEDAKSLEATLNALG